MEVEKPATGKPTSDDSQLNQRSQKHEERCYRISTEVEKIRQNRTCSQPPWKERRLGKALEYGFHSVPR